MERRRGIEGYAIELGFPDSKSFLETLGEAGKNKILDLGSGNGVFLEETRAKGYNIVGVDIDPRKVTQDTNQKALNLK